MRRGFTLIELLVVIAIISVLMGILLPAIGLARRTAQSAAGNANMRSTGQILLMFTGDNDEAFINPFGNGFQEENSGALDYNDALSLRGDTYWDFNAHPIMPHVTTEPFAAYWYSYLSDSDDTQRFREEQVSPADVGLQSLAKGMRDGAFTQRYFFVAVELPALAHALERCFALPVRRAGGHGRTDGQDPVSQLGQLPPIQGFDLRTHGFPAA